MIERVENEKEKKVSTKKKKPENQKKKINGFYYVILTHRTRFEDREISIRLLLTRCVPNYLEL
jgi:hypothetical protein